MANANPSKIHGDDSHSDIPTKEPAKKLAEPLRIVDVSGKAVKVMSEVKLECGTVRRDYA